MSVFIRFMLELRAFASGWIGFIAIWFLLLFVFFFLCAKAFHLLLQFFVLPVYGRQPRTHFMYHVPMQIRSFIIIISFRAETLNPMVNSRRHMSALFD